MDTQRLAIIAKPSNIHSIIEDVLHKIHDPHHELIIVIADAENSYSGLFKYTCGRLVEHLNESLAEKTDKPYYILPIIRNRLSLSTYCIRIKTLTPTFQKVYTDDDEMAMLFKNLFSIEAEMVAPTVESFRLLKDSKDCTRGLFIARAQPFHIGQQSFIEKMLEEVDEVIILVSIAQRAYSYNDPLTASERLEMLKPYLHKRYPGRHYLFALPYSPFKGENFELLKLVLPKFQCLYATNAEVLLMAQSAGYEVKKLDKSIKIKASVIRDFLIEDKEVTRFLPPEIRHYIQKINLKERLQMLRTK